MMQNIKFAVLSDVGRKRKNNEDSYIAGLNKDFFVVADGMGGHNAGEIASGMAVNIISDYIERYREIQQDRSKLLSQAVKKANEAIFHESQLDSRLQNMGTTITAVFLENNNISWAQVGDSRLYRLRNNEMTLITEDQTLVAQLLSQGQISVDEARNHPQRNMLLNAVGVENNVAVDIGEFKCEENDILLLCSDGLSSMLTDDDIKSICISNVNDVIHMCDRLVSEANHMGGSDNITVIAIKIGEWH